MKKFLTVLLVIAVMFTFSFSSAFAAAPAAADQVAFDTGVSVDLQKAANDLIAAEKAVKDGVLAEIFGNAASATLNGAKVKRASVEAIYDKEVYNVKVAAINTELSQKLQAAQAAMQVTSLTAGELATVQGEFGAAVTASSKVVFAGYFVEDSAAKYDYDAVLDTVYVYPAYSTTFTTAVNGTSAYKAVFDDGATPAVDEPTGTKILNVAKEVFKDTKDAAAAAIQGVDLTAYSKDYNGEAQSNYDKAAALVDEYMGKLAQAEANAKAGNTWATYIGWKNYIDALYTAPVNQQPATGEFITKLNAIPKVADAATEEAKLNFAKNMVLAKVKDDISAAYDGQIATLDNSILSEELKGAKADAAKIAKYKEQKEALVEKKDAVTEVATYLVNSKTKVAELIKDYTAADGTFNAATAVVRKWGVDANGKLSWGKSIQADGSLLRGEYNATQMVEMAKKVAELKEDAELLKATIAIDGTTAVGIDEALEDAIDTVYTTGNVSVTLPGNTQLAALVARINALTGTGSVKVNDRSYKAVGSWATTGFEADQNDEVRAAIKEANDTICAAKTIEEADAAFLAALEKFNAIPTTADKTKVQNTKEFKDLLSLYSTDIRNYATYKAAVLDSDDYEWDASTMANNLIADFNDAYTVEELKAAYEAAKAEIDNIKTKAALDAVKKDLDARVNALVGKTVTLADKEAITALNKEIADHNDYCDMLKVNHSKKVTVYAAATNAAEYIKKLEDKAITDAYNAIMKDGKVTVDEKAAVEALRAAYDAYVKDYTAEDAAALTLPSIGNNMGVVEGLLSDALVDEVEVSIAKLAVNPVDVAAVKAARAAYEALSTFEKNAVGRKYYDKLVDCEKLVAKSVESLKIKASSSAKKGSITVKWTVNGNAAAADGYQLYKSTKAQKGYKKCITTTKTSFKNTKNLKKGTRYYYKVRAYAVVDGVKVYSDWSNKANRIAK